MEENEPKKSMLQRISKLDEKISTLPGARYIGRAVEWIRKNPLGFTISSSVVSTLLSLASDSVSVLEGLIMGAVIGGSVDGMNRYEMHRKKAELDKLGNLAKVFSLDYLQALGTVLAEEKGIDARISTFDSVTLDSGGTCILGGGHFDLVTFTYKNGEKTKVLIKASRKMSSKTGFEMSRILNSMFSFVPKPYSIGSYVRTFVPGESSDSPENYRSITNPPIGSHEPCAFEFVEGKCLEGLVNSEMPSMENYDFVSDAVPIKAIFDNMFKVYEFGNGDEVIFDLKSVRGFDKSVAHKRNYPVVLGKYTYSHKLLKRLENMCGEDDEFVNDWWRTRCSEFEKAPVTVIHGDMHQGNVILGDETHIIDWDNAQKGIPYQDFINLAIFTDMDKSSSYEQIKKDFKKRQAELLPGVTEEQMKMTEFEAYMGWALRFAQETLNGTIREEFRDNMLSTSKYLLEKSRQALGEYAVMADRYDLINRYEEFIQKNKVLSEVDKADYNPMASVGYAHSTHQRHTIQCVDDVAQLNLRKDAAYGERVILQNHKNCTIPLTSAAVATGATGFSIGLCLYHWLQNGADMAEYAGAMAVLLPISTLTIGCSLFTYFINQKMFLRKEK